MNYYTTMSSDKSIPCTPEEKGELVAILGKLNESEDLTGIDCEYSHGEIYFFGEENAMVNNLSDEFIIAVGKILKKAKLPYVEFQLGFNADREAPDSQGGAYVRITSAGCMENQKNLWPAQIKQRAAVAAKKIHRGFSGVKSMTVDGIAKMIEKELSK